MNRIEPAKSEKKPGRGHFFCEKAPLFVMVVGTFFITVVYPLMGIAGQGIIRQVLPQLDKDVMEAFCIAVSSFLFLWLFKRWFAPDWQGVLRLHVPLRDVLRWSVPLWVFLGISILLEGVDNGFFFRLTLIIVAMSACAGFFEEAVFRIFTIAIGMRFLSGEKRVWWSLVVSSVVFGLSHCCNVLGGAPMETAIHQAIHSVLFGLYMGALALRTGSYWPTAILHTLYDALAMSTTPGVIDGVMHDTPGVTSYIELVMMLFPAWYGVNMVKKYKTEILALWDRKWGRVS